MLANPFSTERIKERGQRALKQLLKQAMKKLTKAAARLVMMVVKKIIIAIFSFFGLKGCLMMIVVIIIGSSLFFIVSWVGDFVGEVIDGNPKSAQQIKAEYEHAIASTTEYRQYRPDFLLITAIDQIRILKEGGDPWETDPQALVDALAPTIDKSNYKFKTEYLTTHVPKDGESEPYDTSLVVQYKSTLLNHVHAWNVVDQYTYKKVSGTQWNHFSDSENSTEYLYTVYKELVKWEQESYKSEPNFEKLDVLLEKLRFTDDDFQLLVGILQANDSDILTNYSGMYGIIGIDEWWDDDDFKFEGNWIWPTISTRITSGFYVRTHPITGKLKKHQGIDIGVPIVNGKKDTRGQPIFAVEKGTVTHAGNLRGYGQTVAIDHGGGIVTIYAHMKRGSLKVSKGQTVNTGNIIGIMGTTGNSTGIHLHFEVIQNGVKKNPLYFVRKE